MLESYERDPETLWNTDMFGKTFREMVQEGLREKQGVPEEVRTKLRRASPVSSTRGKGEWCVYYYNFHEIFSS